MFRNIASLGSVGIIALLGACSPQPAPTPISVEPTFNKYGVPSCRPVDVPVGGIYTADLPLCEVVAGQVATTPDAPQDWENDTIPDDIDDDVDDDTSDGNQNQNQNQNQNTNQNTNQNQGG